MSSTSQQPLPHIEKLESLSTATPRESESSESSKKTRSGLFPPGPPMRRGIVETIRDYTSFRFDPMGFVRSRFDSYGDIYYAPNKDGRLFVVRHPDHLREVFSTKASSYDKAPSQLAPLLGDGLALTDGEVWKRQRRMVQPAFAPPRMAAYGAIMLDEAKRTADAWAARIAASSSSRPQPIDREMTALTLRIVSRTLFGHDLGEHDIQTIATAMNAFQRSLSSPGLFPAWTVPGRRSLARGLEDLDRIVYRLIRERERERERGRGRGDDGNDGGREPQQRGDLLQLLVDAVDDEGAAELSSTTTTTTTASKQTRLTAREVRDQLVTFFVAGHETTSQALTWAFYCLTRAPEAERALHKELDEVLGDRSPTIADLERLPYTDQVMTEAMRLYPPIFGAVRCAREDTDIGGWYVPRGSRVMLWIYMTHRDPRFYPEPEKFRPERFAKDRAAELPKFAYAPFGGGPRACIGRAFAMMEARLILATLAQRFRLRLAPKQRVAENPLITLSPKYGMKMDICPRK